MTSGRSREKDARVLRAFIAEYCRARHGTRGQLCDQCAELQAYALKRLELCPKNPKPMCKHCDTHCYRDDYRQRIREVMKVAGIRMILKGRLDYLYHYFF